MSSIIAVTHLGLAAHVKMKEARLIRVEAKTFYFELSRTVREWLV